jgi:hypothetical protein
MAKKRLSGAQWRKRKKQGLTSNKVGRPIVCIVVLFAANPASAYRPFDGTDAAVADVGEVEIEFQPIGAMHARSTTKLISDSVLNFGFAERWELVLQGTAQVPIEGGVLIVSRMPLS